MAKANQATKPLTRKQTEFVKEVAKGKTGVEAALKAYNTTKYATANAIAVENLQKPSVKSAIDAEMEKQGITIEAAIKPVAKALRAQKTEYALVNGKMEVVSQTDDLDLQLKGHDRAMKLMGVGRDEAPANMFFANNIEIGKEFVKK